MPTMRRSTQVYAAAATGEAEDKTQRRSKDTYDNVSFSLLVTNKKLRIMGLSVARSCF